MFGDEERWKFYETFIIGDINVMKPNFSLISCSNKPLEKAGFLYYGFVIFYVMTFD